MTAVQPERYSCYFTSLTGSVPYRNMEIDVLTIVFALHSGHCIMRGEAEDSKTS